MKIFLLKNYKKISAIFIIILLVYFAIYIDLMLRARNAYLEAEKYVKWYYNPNEKVEFFEKEFNNKKKELDKLLSKNKLSKDEYDVKLEILEFEKERKIKESSLKYAYIWYKTAIELFSLPESKWVKLAKQKIVNIKDMWRKELEQKGYKIEDYMLE